MIRIALFAATLFSISGAALASDVAANAPASGEQPAVAVAVASPLADAPKPSPVAVAAVAPEPAPVASDAASKPAAAPASTTAARDPNEKVCVMYRPIGTNRASRLCRTRAQIDREREHAEKELDNQIQRGRIN